MDKSDLRFEAERVRAALNLQGNEAEQAADHFIQAIPLSPGMIVALYWPIRREIDTLPLMDRLHQMGVKTALPVITPDILDLQFVVYDGRQTLKPGPKGIPQPEGAFIQPDIVVLPLLAFDRKGYRLGYGGGYYDRTLAKLLENGHKITSIGYAYAEQICLFPLPRDDHDQKLDWVITPQTVHDFRG